MVFRRSFEGKPWHADPEITLEKLIQIAKSMELSEVLNRGKIRIYI